MTIAKEEPGVWIVCCDTCGERVELDIDPDDSFMDAVEAVKQLDYSIRDESYRLPKEGLEGAFRTAKQSHWTHTCVDCQASDKPIDLHGISSMTDLRITVQESRPYRLGREAAETGTPRDQNPMQSPSGIERWYLGYDDVVQEHAADRLGV